MFGSYNVPFDLKENEASVSMKTSGRAHTYSRTSCGETVEKIVLADGERVVISPVEPVNTPKNIARYLLIEFSKDIYIEPKSEMPVFVTFPIELGVVIFRKKAHEVLDVFSMVKQKYTLYGSPGRGTICRYWKSDVFMTWPDSHRMSEGSMELLLKNETSEWITVRKVVFSAAGMKMYYDAGSVVSKAIMTITGQEMAETEFYDKPPEKGMKKSVELFVKKKLASHQPRFYMEEGLI